MNYNRIVQTLINRLGSRDDLQADIELELANAQENLETSWEDPEMPWFLARSGIIPLPAASTSVQVPNDFIREYDAGVTLLDGLVIEKVSPEKLDFQGCLGRYSLVNNTITVDTPDPDNDRIITLPYYGRQASLSVTVQNNAWSDNAAELLMARTGAVLSAYIRDAALIGIFAQAEQLEKSKLMAATYNREWSNRPMELNQ